MRVISILNFFHATATARKKANSIKKHLDSEGIFIEDQAGLCGIAKEYFEFLFTGCQGSYDPIINIVRPDISTEDNIDLTRPFTIEEFSCAIHQMPPYKALGLDGFNAGFYRLFWGLSVHEIFGACTLWLDRGSFPLSFNETNIVLSPSVIIPRG